MNIGQASEASGVSAKMIRYYEQTGLIRAADRKSSGYRDYSEQDVHVLQFIRKSRDLGFSVTEIADLLQLWQDRSRHSADVKRIALIQIERLNSKVQELKKMAATLEKLASCCSGDNRPDCPILEGLEKASPPLSQETPSLKRRGAVEALNQPKASFQGNS